MEDTLDREVLKRLYWWYKKNLNIFVIGIIANLLGFVILFLYFRFVFGLDHAIQNTFENYSTWLVIEGISLFLSVLYLAFGSIPSEIYKEQRKIVDERLPGQLSLSIEKTPNVLFKGERQTRAAALHITSLETKKIVEMRALINFHHFYLRESREFPIEASYSLNAPLFWIEDGLPKTEIEMRPEIGKILLICELAKWKIDENEVWAAQMGSDPTINSSSFAEESIFNVKILFQGRLEGDYDFRTFHYETSFYTKPVSERILFLDVAEKTYSDIPSRFLVRSKAVIKFLETKNKRSVEVEAKGSSTHK